MTFPGSADNADRDDPESVDAAEPLDAEIVEQFASPDFTPAVQGPTVEEVTGYTESGVPTFDFVRDKIEHRTATADGGQFLAESGREAAELDEAMSKRDDAARSKLDEIRKSMGL